MKFQCGVRAAVRELNSVQSRYREQNVGLGLRLEGFLSFNITETDNALRLRRAVDNFFSVESLRVVGPGRQRHTKVTRRSTDVGPYRNFSTNATNF